MSDCCERRLVQFREWGNALLESMRGNVLHTEAQLEHTRCELRSFAMWLEELLYRQRRLFDVAAPSRGRRGYKYKPSDIMRYLFSPRN